MQLTLTNSCLYPYLRLKRLRDQILYSPKLLPKSAQTDAVGTSQVLPPPTLSKTQDYIRRISESIQLKNQSKINTELYNSLVALRKSVKQYQDYYDRLEKEKQTSRKLVR